MPGEPGTAASAAPEDFRRLMSSVPAGVAVITAADLDGTLRGMTCSTVCSVALDPPTLLVCLRSGSPTLDAVLRTSSFAVNLLHEGARATAELFASGDPDRFDRVDWAAGAMSASPHLGADAHAVADCRVTGTVDVGDHHVVFGRVLDVHRTAEHERSPLLYGFRRYSSWTAAR